MSPLVTWGAALVILVALWAIYALFEWAVSAWEESREDEP